MKEITLKEAKNIKLFNRVEKKYVLTPSQLYDFYKYLSSDSFYIVKNNNNFLFDYHSIYYDTINLDMYNDHKNDKVNRQKLRIREYQNGNKYLEIKSKLNGITKKIRRKINSEDISILQDWLKENLNYNLSLNKELDIKYKRITFISEDKKERITIDSEIKFYNYENNISESIKDIIVEVKHEKGYPSLIEMYFIRNNIKYIKFSKYYTGMSLTKKEE